MSTSRLISRRDFVTRRFPPVWSIHKIQQTQHMPTSSQILGIIQCGTIYRWMLAGFPACIQSGAWETLRLGRPVYLTRRPEIITKHNQCNVGGYTKTIQSRAMGLPPRGGNVEKFNSWGERGWVRSSLLPFLSFLPFFSSSLLRFFCYFSLFSWQSWDTLKYFFILIYQSTTERKVAIPKPNNFVVC